MSTLVTGGTGLVGSSISQGVKLSSGDGDLRDWNSSGVYYSFWYYLLLQHTW